MASICITVGLVTPTSPSAETTSSLRDSSEKFWATLWLPPGADSPGCYASPLNRFAAIIRGQALTTALGLMRIVLTREMDLLAEAPLLGLPAPALTMRTDCLNSTPERCISSKLNVHVGGLHLERQQGMETRNCCALLHPKLLPLVEKCLLNDALNNQGGILEIRKARSR